MSDKGLTRLHDDLCRAEAHRYTSAVNARGDDQGSVDRYVDSAEACRELLHRAVGDVRLRGMYGSAVLNAYRYCAYLQEGENIGH